MKKYLFGALALPLLFACSSDDLLEKKVVSNDQFAGIEKVDATFSMAEGSTTRMATDWALEEGDQYGFAWLGDGTVIPGDGRAYQNHPLIQKGNIFEPQTSIYVGDYFLYRPYDKTVVDIENINFKSLETQTLSDGMGGDSWKALAAGTIIIGDKWTNVTKGGWTDLAGNTWDKAGIKEHYNIYAAIFSNQTGLDLSYVKNNVDFGGKAISGATDISYTYPAGSTIGAADIYKIEATLTGATQSFQYAPSAEPNGAAHDGNFWETQSDLATAFPGDFDFTLGGLGGVTYQFMLSPRYSSWGAVCWSPKESTNCGQAVAIIEKLCKYVETGDKEAAENLIGEIVRVTNLFRQYYPAGYRHEKTFCI